MAEYTLTYSESVQGFPSFYSYIPDMMIGMNNYFYSFKAGELYRHNTNNTRNQYYYDYWNKVGTPSSAIVSSMIKSVFNDAPLENKIFKTINLESTDPWTATLQTDLQTNGNVDYSWFKKKESDWFAFVRAVNDPVNPVPTDQYALRNLNGIGNSTNVQVGVPAVGDTTVTFALTTDIGSIISIGDYLYFIVGGVPSFAGVIEQINVNIPGGINTIVINNTGGAAIPAVVTFFLAIKNATAESHGMTGHYCEFTLTLPNTFTAASELFAVESEVMKSYP
tara:strand:- start:3724 stop:4560 length:837 start_codon:yes stop_codon:yes gene_type:complete